LSAFHPGSRAEIGVFCHEFGHALGLPDLYDTAPQTPAFNVGPGNWSLMSTGMYGTNGLSPESPSHLGAWPTLFLGWTTTVRPTRDSLMVLGPIENGSSILDLWFQGEPSSEHYLIENRQRLGFDQHLLQEGLIVYRVDEASLGARLGANQVNVGPRPALRIVEADGVDDLVEGRSRGSRRDPFPGVQDVTIWDESSTPSTRSFLGAATNVALRTILAVGDSMRFLAQVRARG
jgi:immune inhibitor A